MTANCPTLGALSPFLLFWYWKQIYHMVASCWPLGNHLLLQKCQGKKHLFLQLIYLDPTAWQSNKLLHDFLVVGGAYIFALQIMLMLTFTWTKTIPFPWWNIVKHRTNIFHSIFPLADSTSPPWWQLGLYCWPFRAESKVMAFQENRSTKAKSTLPQAGMLPNNCRLYSLVIEIFDVCQRMSSQRTWHVGMVWPEE